MATEILIRLRGTDDDPQILEESASALRAELLDLDVLDVLPVSAGPAPAGTRAMDVAEIGSLLVSIAQAPEALRQVVFAVRAWLARDTGGRRAELSINGDTLTVTGISAETQEQLIEAWLSTHTPTRTPRD